MKSKLRAILPAFFALLSLALPAALGQPTVSVVTAAPTSPVPPGQSVTMAVSASGSLSTYQWKLNGADILGATAASYTVAVAGAADRGSYKAVVTGSGGSVTTEMGTMSVIASDARLINLSARAMVGTGNDVLIAGFVSQGDASSTNKNILMRSMGPSLAAMMGGMNSGVLSNPVLTIYDGKSKAMGSNVGWMNAPSLATGSGASTVPATMQSASITMMNALGAFAPTAGSTDSALMMNAPSGAYTAIMSGANNVTGIGLVECYDADSASGNATNTARLVNMSARANAGVGDNSLIAGFVIVPGPMGSPATVLLRAMGPALAPMGVTNFMATPAMTLFDGASKPIASNAGWGNAPTIAAGNGASPVRAGVEPAAAGMMAQVGAFPATTGSADSALVATLPPGVYSVVVSGSSDNPRASMTGVVLVEVYEMK